jgi:aspartate aminotransferase-like enzyme
LPKIREFQKRWETPFTPALPLFFALDEALAMLIEEGLENRIKRHLVCAEAFYSGVKELGLELFANEHWRSNVVIAVKNPTGITDKDIRDLMRERYGVVVAGGMGKLKGTMFRIGSMGVVSDVEVETTLEALKGALSHLRTSNK